MVVAVVVVVVAAAEDSSPIAVVEEVEVVDADSLEWFHWLHRYVVEVVVEEANWHWDIVDPYFASVEATMLKPIDRNFVDWMEAPRTRHLDWDLGWNCHFRNQKFLKLL